MVADLPPRRRSALEAAAYLTRSVNRMTVLEALCHGPIDRRAVVASTGISTATAGRILTEFQDRGWAERTREGYVTTPTGDWLHGAYEQFLDDVETIQHLGSAIGWLPDAELTVPLRHFRDSTVHRAAPNSPDAAARALHDLVEDAASFETLTYLAPPQSMAETMRDRAAAGHLEGEHVLTLDLVEYLQHRAGQRACWRAYLDAGATVYCCDRPIPCNLFRVDKRVLVANTRPSEGQPCEFIETGNGEVLTWAQETVASYRAAAVPVARDVFADPPAVDFGAVDTVAQVREQLPGGE